MNIKKFWIDHLRVIATFCVILLHVSAAPVPKFGVIDLKTWWIGNILDGSVRFSVPVFFMISGALLLSKEYTLSYFIRKRFLRLVPPFIFWSFVYIIYELAGNLYNGEMMSMADMLRFTLVSLYRGSSYHLWFVYSIIGIYLVVPIISKWTKSVHGKELLYLILIWGIMLFFNYPSLEKLTPSIELRYFTGNLGYMILGFYLANNQSEILNNKWTGLIMVIVGNLIAIFGTYTLSKNMGSFDRTMYVYLTPNVALSSTGLFLLFKNVAMKSEIYKKVITFLSSYSYGVYLVHILILSLISKFGINWQMTTPLVSILVTSVVCFVISNIVIITMSKLKIFQKIAG